MKVVFGSLFTNFDSRFIDRNELGFEKNMYFGRGSMPGHGRVKSYLLDENVPVILDVGSMCCFGEGAEIIIDGEHGNEAVINTDFSAFPTTKTKLRRDGRVASPLKTKGKTVIGSNVVVSKNAIILSGVTIGNGAVIGAGAIVTKDIPAFAIAVGNPAKAIGYRFEESVIEKLQAIRWWDFEYDYLFSNLPRIQKMSTDEFITEFEDVSNNTYHTSKDRFVFSGFKGQNQGKYHIKCLGCELDGKYIPYEELNAGIKFYVDQTKNPLDQNIFLVRNILDCRE